METLPPELRSNNYGYSFFRELPRSSRNDALPRGDESWGTAFAAALAVYDDTDTPSLKHVLATVVARIAGKTGTVEAFDVIAARLRAEFPGPVVPGASVSSHSSWARAFASGMWQIDHERAVEEYLTYVDRPLNTRSNRYAWSGIFSAMLEVHIYFQWWLTEEAHWNAKRDALATLLASENFLIAGGSLWSSFPRYAVTTRATAIVPRLREFHAHYRARDEGAAVAPATGG